jgi:hypothetical protein
MPRRLSLLPALALSALLGAAAPAAAQLPAASACGSGLPTLATTTESAHFRVDDSVPASGLDIAQAVTVLEAVHAKLDEFGWPATPPPSSPAANGRFHVKVSTAVTTPSLRTEGTFAGPVEGGNNPATLWADQDALVTCLLLPAAPPSANALREGVARELTRARLHGIGALSGPNKPEPWLEEGAVVAMVDEIFPAIDAPADDLPPAWTEALGDYDATPAANAWLILRGLTERFGTGQANGAEQVIQEIFEYTSGRGPGGDNLTAVDAALTAGGRNTTLAQAFHDYAIAARFLKPCGADAQLPHCFADAAAYAAKAGPRDAQKAIAALGEKVSGEVEDDHALNWVDVPAARADVTVSNLATAGILQASFACETASGLRVQPLGAAIAAGQSVLVRAVDGTGCTAPTVVITTASRTAPNPTDPPTRAYEVATSAPTATLGVARFGTGTIKGSSGTAAPIDCGATCSAVLPYGTKVTLTPTPGTGQVFSGWAGDCAGTGACVVTVDRARIVAAGFKAGAPAPVATPKPPAGTPVLPTTPTGSTEDTVGPKVVFAKPRFSKQNAKLNLEIRCPDAEPDHCTGPVAAVIKVGKRNIRLIGQSIVNVPGGDKDVVTYALSKRHRALLARVRSVRVTVAILARDDAFNQSFLQRVVTVRTARR